MKYRVTLYFSEICNIEAEDEAQAEEKARMLLKNLNGILIPDSCEVECLEKEEDEECD